MTKIVFFSLICFCTAFLQAQEQSKRYVLLEEFSNTYCPPCIFRHPAFHENILEEYEDVEVFHISYHVGTPIPDDVFYQANIEEVEQRAAYYQILGTPSLQLLGEFSPSGPSPDYDILPLTTLQEHTGSISPLKIEVQENNESNQERSVHIEVKTVNQIIPSNQFRLRVVVIEKVVDYEPPFEGMETRLHNIFRQTLGGWDGEVFSPAKVGEAVSYDFSYTIEEEWESDQIYVIAFIQDDNNQSILNAGSSWKNEVVNIEGKAHSKEVKIYPNPSQDFVFLESQENPQFIQIFDLQGRILQTATFDPFNASIDIGHLPKGTYFLSLQLESERIVEKITKW